MSVIRGCLLAFSMYSRLPMPKADWNEKNMRYMLCFFPFIGALQGIFLYGLWKFCDFFELPVTLFILSGTALPVLLTGGIHLDGFLDTMDALHSYQSRERKLEILKDAHIGAFACIWAVCWALLYAAALSLIQGGEQLLLAGCGFFRSRALSAVTLVTFKSAKKEGTLYTFASAAHKKRVLVILLCAVCLAFGFAQSTCGIYGGCCILLGFLPLLYYWKMSYKEFGGLTGDLAGWFVTVFELWFLWESGVLRLLWSL